MHPFLTAELMRMRQAELLRDAEAYRAVAAFRLRRGRRRRPRHPA